MWRRGRPRRFGLRLPRRRLHLLFLLLLFRWSRLAARGGFWKLVVVIVTLEAFTCLKLSLMLPTGLVEQWRATSSSDSSSLSPSSLPALPLAGGDSPTS